MLSIEISNRQQALSFNAERLRSAAEAVLRDAGIVDAELSIAITDDATIHQLNREYLRHDYPTDVLSFVLDRDGKRLDGEVIASAQTAIQQAANVGWQPDDELLLYVIHGTLHLVGYDDTTDAGRAQMQTQERHYLAMFGL